ncbi:integrase core domain-containing protein [Chitinimonas koreensis]|uniref:integrase core domain-containing protein n=1 Tax=Chitinimonas koreensis TaxID=356302 RepID=UPI00040CC8FC|nr:integrase core domain-containing protein [Chitinimonas koreensis]QNM98711.1 transposase [Chitinimonas koreensis]
MDNGPEFTSKALDQWAYQYGVRLQFIRPGEPVNYAYTASLNGRFREECFNHQAFRSQHDAQQKIEAWRLKYNAATP